MVQYKKRAPVARTHNRRNRVKTVTKIVKITALVLIFAVIALLIFRIIIADHYPAAMSALYVSEADKEAYAREGAAMELRHQKLRFSYDRSRQARFFAAHQYYIPASGELQVALRYSNYTLETLQADFALSETPLPDASLFDITLVTRAPDGSVVRYPVTCVAEESAFLYHYMKLVASGVDFSAVSSGSGLWLSIYYKDAVNYDEDPYAYILVYETDLTADDTVWSPDEKEFA